MLKGPPSPYHISNYFVEVPVLNQYVSFTLPKYLVDPQHHEREDAQNLPAALNE
jgi:hypothetical protein